MFPREHQVHSLAVQMTIKTSKFIIPHDIITKLTPTKSSLHVLNKRNKRNNDSADGSILNPVINSKNVHLSEFESFLTALKPFIMPPRNSGGVKFYRGLLHRAL